MLLIAASAAAGPAPAGPGYTRPKEVEKGCVGRSVRLPQDATPPRRATLKFAVGRDGRVGPVEVLEPVAPEVAAALTRALQSCTFEPGRGPDGAPAEIWVFLPLRFADRPPPWDHLGDPPRPEGGDAAPPLPPRAPVIAPDGLVDGASRSRLFALAAQARADGRPPLTILVVASLGGQDLRGFARRAYLGWPLGSPRTDDGLLLVVDVAGRDWLLQPGAAVGASVAEPGLFRALGEALDGGLRSGALGPALVAAAELVGNAARAESLEPVERPVAGLDRGGSAVLWSGVVQGIAGVLVALLVPLFVSRLRRRRMTAGVHEPEAGWQLEAREADGQLELRTRHVGGRFVVLAPVALAAVFLATLLARPRAEPVVLTCAAGEDRCSVTRGGEELAWVQLAGVTRFLVTTPEPKKGHELRAATWRGNFLLLRWGDRAELLRHAEALNEFLARGRDELVFRYDPPAGSAASALALVAVLLGLGALAWLFTGAWRVRLDRAAGSATLERPLRRRRRPLAEVAAVQVWTRRDEQIEQAARQGRPVPYAPPADPRERLSLVDVEGRRWPVTPWLQGGASLEGLPAVAQRVSRYLGIPLLPPPPEPPSGAVPPADWAKITPSAPPAA